MKKQLLISLALLCIGVSAFSQKKKTTDDDATPVQLQGLSSFDRHDVEREHDKLLEKNTKEFNDGDPTFKPNTIPDKWKNESAVIIGQKAEYDYYSSAGGWATCDEIVRRKIMLIDQSAVEKFSSVTYTPNQEVGYRIIKKNGTIKNVNTLNAVPIQDNYPASGSMFFIPIHYSVPVTRYFKLAIPDLEPGDIFEYYYVDSYMHQKLDIPSGTSLQAYKYGIPFPAIIYTLDEEYPIMKQREEFNVQKGFYINYSSTNGAPKFSEASVVDKKTKLFAITDENREKRSTERWKYDYRSDPTIKFQVVYTSEGDKDDMPYMLGQPFTPVTKVPHELIQGVADQVALEKMEVSTQMATDVTEYMYKNYKKLNDSVRYMQIAYYYMRYYMYVKKRKQYEAGDYNKEKIADIDFKNFIPDSPDDFLSDELFIKAMGYVARKAGVECELEFGVPRSIGTLDNLVLKDEMEWHMRINGVKDLFLYPFNGYSNPNEPLSSMEGTHDYSLLPSEKAKKVVMNETNVPVSACTSNISLFTINASLNSAIEGDVTVSRNATVKGLSKQSFYPDVLVQNIYEDQEAKKYGDKTEQDNINHLSAKKRDAEAQKYNDYINDKIKKRKEVMSVDAKDEYDVDEYDDFNLVSSGMELDSTTLKFNEAFKVKDLVKKVGPNYTMQVGKLIGGQLQLNAEDSARKSDVYLYCAREVDNEVDLDIPSGYKVEGVNSLNMSVTNTTGGFVSTAAINGSKLVITTKKYYSSNYEPIASWPDMEKFLQAAYDFTQKKILLKKA